MRLEAIRHFALFIAVALVSTVHAAEGIAPAERKVARDILAATGVKGGLIVHLGCGDGKLTAALRASARFVVHGLDSDATNVEAARRHVQSLGLYGAVSVEQWSGSRLPHVDNLVNLLVSGNLGSVPRSEILRVLVPNGVAYVKQGAQWTKAVKPRPKDLDEWTHYLHDSSNNAVAHDTVVGPPRHLQWVGSPTYTRHHDHMSSFSAMVSAGGRVFYVIDEGLRAEIQLPSSWSLVARDAFNGTVLWKRPIPNWHTRLWPAKSGPAQLPRRLVAVGDTVYVALGLDAPLTALDAATGKTIRTYDRTKATEEVLWADGALFALVNDRPTKQPWATLPGYPTIAELRGEPDKWSWSGDARTVVALDANTGKTLWQQKSPVAPLTLTANASRVLFHDGGKVVCLDRANGRQLWTSKPVPRAAEIRSWFAPTLVVYQDVVLFAGAEKMVRHSGGKDTMTALSAKTGELLWTAEHPPSGYDSPEDVLIVDGLVWTAPTTNRRDSGEFTGRDVHTGEIKKTFPSDCGDHMPHHRCHRGRATDRYLLMSRTGIEYVDCQAQHWDRNDWVRGACLYGLMPANGLTYAPPQSCACYLVAKLSGLNALAPESPSRLLPKAVDGADRLVRGPAYDALADPQSTIPNRQSQDWPTYRHDETRGGFTSVSVRAALRCSWQTAVGGKLSSPVVAEGKVLVASIDTHTVHALAAASGEKLWSFTAGGRVDSPPTVWQGGVLFGSADGYVYCLRADDGVLAWRFRAAPVDRRLMAFEQLESAWPVHGSVLVHDGIVHCVAGRSMFLDGGMRYLRLAAATGKVVSETVMDNVNPDTGQPLDADVKWPNLPVALPDILSCDGKSVYMRSQRFDLDGKRINVAAPSDYKDQTGEGAHLFSPTGFLDDSWWHRTYWLYGKTCLGGAGGWYNAAFRAPTGRLMVVDDKRVYSFDRRPQYYPSTTALEYHLFAADKEPKILGEDPNAKPPARANRVMPTRPELGWSYQVPLLGRALVKAGDTVFVAGPPDLVDEELTLTRLDAPETEQSLREQSEAYLGKKGALLLAVSSEGQKLAAYRLESMPVFDGMAAVDGRLYLSTVDGKVLCLAGEGQPLQPAPDVTLREPEVAARARGGIAATTSHPDFQQLSQVQVTSAELGWRLEALPGQVGFALKQLATPLTKQATFRFKLHLIPKDTSPEPPRNGFLVFGDAPDDAHLVKCGMRRAQCMITQGPYQNGKTASKLVESKVGEVTDVLVTVDLTTQQVTLTVHGQTVEAKLDRPLEAIRFIGYLTNSVASEFSPVAVMGE
jgi:outer membrane protein assembly factor BamB